MDKIFKKLVSHLPENVKNTETAKRLASETSDYFKPIKKAGGLILIGGIALKITTLLFPATLPVALVSFIPDLIEWGGLMYFGSSLTKKK